MNERCDLLPGTLEMLILQTLKRRVAKGIYTTKPAAVFSFNEIRKPSG
jgi:hypothetical protein